MQKVCRMHDGDLNSNSCQTVGDSSNVESPLWFYERPFSKVIGHNFPENLVLRMQMRRLLGTILIYFFFDYKELLNSLFSRTSSSRKLITREYEMNITISIFILKFYIFSFVWFFEYYTFCCLGHFPKWESVKTENYSSFGHSIFQRYT